MTKYYAVALIGVLITAISQVLLKLGALHGKARYSLLRSYLNFYTVTGLAMIFGVTLLNTYAFKFIALKMAVVLVPLAFILAAMMSFWVLGEKFS